MKKQVSVLGKQKRSPSSSSLEKMKPTKSLEDILADWQNEAGITEEQKSGRQEAAKRIRECANNKSTRLNLSFLKLSSLPAEIFKPLTQLERLDLNHSQLSRLPEKLFTNLTQLRSLDLGHNQLPRLPEKLFEQLTQLTYLSLSKNQLSRLPEKLFEQLTQLKYLFLNHNRLVSLPARETLKQLRTLDLEDNRFSAVMVESIRSRIGWKTHCNINIYDPGNRALQLSDYRFTDLLDLLIQELDNNDLNTDLFKRSVDGLKPLESSMSSFVLFLQKLPMMRDWGKQGSHLQLLKHIAMIINAMADSQPIRQQCETIAADSVDTCGDRVALGLIRMSVAVSHFSKSVWSKNSLYEYGKVVSRFETIMALARTKASTMGGAVDEIEVILKYLKELNQPLTLGLPITEMLYEACSGIDDNDIKRALDYVTRAEPMSIHAYLAGFDGTRTVFGDDFDKIENAFDTNQIGDESDADYVKRMTRLPEQLRQARIELLESRYANNVADSASSATAATSEADLDVAGCAEVSEISDSADSATDAYARDDNVNSGGVIESKNSG